MGAAWDEGGLGGEVRAAELEALLEEKDEIDSQLKVLKQQMCFCNGRCGC